MQASAYCITPKDKKIISENTEFCPQTYQLPSGIAIGRDKITIDCRSAIIQGLFQGRTGILVENKKDVVIQNCMLINYNIGIQLVNSTNISIVNTALIRNQIGIKIERSNNNTIIKNRDISLKRPVQEIESFDNIFNYENKDINADFCRYNTCNQETKINRTPDKTILYRNEDKLQNYSLREILMEAIQIWLSTD